jgi:catechol 2,3-dioxygenase-like lactoylglutathione lyase family enzyme
MVEKTSGWSLRSVLISVSDLDRSISFYQDLMKTQELRRADQIAILGSDVTGSLMFILRQASRSAVHSGQQSLGLRSLSCNVGPPAELDRVEERLRALNAFRDRLGIGDGAKFEVVRGYDPDRLPMTFVAFEVGSAMSPDDYLGAMAQMYDVDI